MKSLLLMLLVTFAKASSTFEGKLVSSNKHLNVFLTLKPGARFSKAPETFRARKAIFSKSSVSENGELYTPEISFVKTTSVYIIRE